MIYTAESHEISMTDFTVLQMMVFTNLNQL
jgi:hypothetical protein